MNLRLSEVLKRHSSLKLGGGGNVYNAEIMIRRHIVSLTAPRSRDRDGPVR